MLTFLSLCNFFQILKFKNYIICTENFFCRLNFKRFIRFPTKTCKSTVLTYPHCKHPVVYGISKCSISYISKVIRILGFNNLRKYSISKLRMPHLILNLGLYTYLVITIIDVAIATGFEIYFPAKVTT